MMDGNQEARLVTCSAPVNIAVVKYWGKRDEDLILPVNSSLSVTLDQTQLKATTTVALSKRFTRDRLWVNGREEATENPRLKRCLEAVRMLAWQQHDNTAQYEGCVHICSVNNFPTAAGLASSAAGYACLVYSLSQLFNVRGDISGIARQGSGSACRSVYGGFVKWEEGECEDGSDSVAKQVTPATHWPELEVLILVVSAERKSVSSTAGMQSSVQTSNLLKYRAEVVVPQRMTEMEEAIKKRDFQTFAKLTMQDSNQFHAICLDTYPPILYLNDTSKRIIQLVTKYNELQGRIKVAYTFDAGPNAVLFTLTQDMPQLLSLVHYYFPPGEVAGGGYIRGTTAGKTIEQTVDATITGHVLLEPSPGALQYIIHTKVGEGPRLLGNPEEHLLSPEGVPKQHTIPQGN